MFEFIESLTTKQVFVDFEDELTRRFPELDAIKSADAGTEFIGALRDAVNAAFLAGYLVGRDPDKLLLAGVLAQETR
ncbi:MAG: hypothetical protein IPK79_00820 [Vampirovibrionales bacterium]|nr:hypothetical protein [Vampirovibrionales bacterium]